MKKIFKRVVIVAVVAVLAAAGIMVVKKRKAALEAVPPPRPAPVVVRTARVEQGRFPVYGRYLGTIRPKVGAEIASRIQERIVEVRVREGDRVKKGDLLVLLDQRVQKARVEAVEAKLAAARTELATQEAIFARDKRLFAAKAISREEFDLSRARRDAALGQVKSLEAELLSAKADLSYARITAPFDGVVTHRYQDPGDLAVPGRAILAMEDPSRGYYVEIKVPQERFQELKRGMEVLLRRRGGETRVEKAVVSRVHPAADEAGLAVVEADVAAPPLGLPSGGLVDATLVFRRVEGFRVPLRALLENSSTNYLFGVEQGRIVLIPVEVLFKGDDGAVVLGKGLSPGAQVVVAQESELLRLHPGENVVTASKEEVGP